MKRVAIAFLVLLALAAALYLRHRSSRSSSSPPSATTGAAATPARGGATHAGGESERGRPLRLSPATATQVDAAALALGGRVLSSADGKPIARASLTFLRGGAALSVESDAAGRFAIAPAQPGAYELTSALADGYLPFEPQLGHSPLVLFARPGVRIDDANIYLTPVLRVTVHVVNERGQPIAGAQVRAIHEGGGAAGEPLLSDAKGNAHVNTQPFDLVEASKAGFRRARQRVNYVVQGNKAMTMTLIAGSDAPLGTIAGRVVDGRGQPVDGALVESWTVTRNEDSPDRAQALSGADGCFVLADLDGSRYTVRATARGLGSAESADVAVGARDLELKLGAPSAGLRGVVRDGRDRPVTAFSIVAWPRVGVLGRGPGVSAAVVDAEGRYGLELPPGNWEVRVAARGFATSADRVVAIADAPVTADFTLTRGGRIVGRITDRQSGAPIAGADVELEGVGAGDVAITSDNTSGPDGSFRVEGVGAGVQSLVVHADGHDGRIVSGLRVPTDGELGPLTIDLKATPPGEDPRLELVGIGAVLGADPAGMVIKMVAPDGGAAAAGLQPGDIIVTIDGQSVDQIGFNSAIELIRGPENSVVILTINRAGSTTVTPVTRKPLTS